MKASNAASASLLVSAIQISCNDRLAFGCWLFGSLLRTLTESQPLQRHLQGRHSASARAPARPHSRQQPVAAAGADARPRNSPRSFAGTDRLDIREGNSSAGSDAALRETRPAGSSDSRPACQLGEGSNRYSFPRPAPVAGRAGAQARLNRVGRAVRRLRGRDCGIER
jgi:hypothetical protein